MEAKKLTELTVEVKAKLGVSRETAEACLSLVQLYCNDNGCDLQAEKQIDGTHKYSIKKAPVNHIEVDSDALLKAVIKLD